MMMSRYKFTKWLLLVLVLPVVSFAQEKQRRVNRTFQTNPNTELEVRNQFGRVHVSTWDKNEIQLEVIIRAEFRNEAKSQEFVDRVEIEISESPSLISLETDFDGKVNSRRGESFSVDYTISFPSSNALDISNKFGDIYVGNHTGDLEIDLKYGKMKGDKLIGDSDIEIGFGGANIDELGNSELEVKYSDVRVNKVLDLDLEQHYSDVEIDNIEDLRLRSKYGELELGTIQSVKGDAGFTDFEIEEVAELVDLDMEYVGDFRISRVLQGFKEIRLDAKYTAMDVRIDGGVDGQFEGVFRYSDLDHRGEGIDLNYVVKDYNRKEYKGKIGSGGSALIWVDSSYGDLRMSIGN